METKFEVYFIKQYETSFGLKVTRHFDSFKSDLKLKK